MRGKFPSVEGDSQRDGRTQNVWGPGGPPQPRELGGDEGPAGYRLGARLGDAGDVYEAQHPRFPGPLAIKLFPRAVGEGPLAVSAFAREAGRVSILRHPRIAQVLDSGVLPNRTPFVAMERLQGQTLEDFLVHRGLLALSEAFSVIRDIVLGLSAAHEAGVVHRELRPDNIFLVGRDDKTLGFVKLLDFGVSQLTWAPRAAGRGISVDGARYLAPEQVRRGLSGIDARTDEFALAVLTYRMLRGPDPFLGPAIARASAVDTVLGKALGDNPGDRFPSVGHFFRAFEEAIISAVPTPAPLRTRRGAPHATASDESAATPKPISTRKGWASPRASASDNAITKEVVLFASPKRDLHPAEREVVRKEVVLAERFFEEGDRHEETRWKNAPVVREQVGSAPDIHFSSFDRLPRRRTPLVTVLLLLAIAGTAFAGHKLGWPSPRAVWDESRVGRTVYFFRAGLPWLQPAASTPPQASTPVTAAPRGDVVPSVTAEPAGAIAPSVPAEPADEVPPSVTAEPSGEVAPSVAAEPAGVDVAGTPAREKAPPRRKAEAPARRDRGSALRGYVWSPREQRMVPAAR